MKKKKVLALVLATVMTMGTLAGCGQSEEATTEATEATEEPAAEPAVEEAVAEETTEAAPAVEGGELTMLIDTDVSIAGFNAVAELAKQKLGITITIETRPGGADGDNVVKTRLASGDMADLCAYNSGALLSALNPSEYFLDLSGEALVDRLDDTYKSSVTVDGKVYGIPLGSSQAGAIIYSKTLYEKYGLSVPKTWDEFLANCDVLKENGETAILGTFADSWTSQVAFLGDNYNLMSAEADFIKNLEAGSAKYASTPAALRSFEKLADTTPYYNEDYLATTYDDGCDMMANAEAGHWFMLTQSLSNVYELYGAEAVDALGVFAVPGDNADDNGLTVWMPTSVYGNKNSEKTDLIKAFMEFYVSDEALNAYSGVILPDGPFCIKGYTLPDNAYEAVAVEMQSYFDAGKTNVAAEFLTSVKGADCPTICQELGSGQTTALEAAEKYDADCAKQAKQLGLNWE